MDGRLPTTRWTLVARLHAEDEPLRRAALDELCSQYHYPLYCFIRRSGFDHHDAQDALQGFFAKLLRNDTFAGADAAKGRLRSFLLTALRRFLINWRRDQRYRAREISAEAEAAMAGADERYQQQRFVDTDSPDLAYDRQWARQVMETALHRVRERQVAKGRGDVFDALHPVLITGGRLADHDSAAIAAHLGMKPGTLRMALFRLLDDFRETLRNEIAQTTEDPEDLQDEFRYLARVFGG